MTRIISPVELEISGAQLADWWWSLDSFEQADFFARIAAIREDNPTAFLRQLQWQREVVERAFGLASVSA